jgi:hypothetical protein
MKSFFIFCLFFSMAAHAGLIQRPFVTDGCTDWVNGTKTQPNLWLHCCVEHDLHFWAGGTKEMRDTADLRLRDCVSETGAKTEAIIMYWGVRLGSISPIKYSSMAWGNAWIKTGYETLSPAQVEAIEADLPHYDLPEEMKQGLVDALSVNQDR